ncbi:hypothetical protein [Lysinibacillus fusiformis]|uniref:hypothetical protein n=1 Tax=Lysinibacillus fusiformis TaxID=28031 RepID=UPI001247A9BE|nr:hypothetical protein [Lysinibacillus fusiformis]KAB0442317.1 hypothetical protein CH314_15025 [Lysinibacillus fusiformis]
MTVGIYRNRLNQEIKRFGKFGKKIVESLNEKGITTELIFNPKVTKCILELKKHDTIVIISHGSADSIYHKFDGNKMNHQVLINESNLDILNEKKVIAISCGTARELGELACTSAGCKTYLGFYNKIHFNKKNGNEPSLKYHMFISECYKDSFKEVLEMAIENNWTFNKLKLVMERELKKTVVERATNVREKHPRYYFAHEFDQSIIAVSDVANNIHLFGDKNEKVS